MISKILDETRARLKAHVGPLSKIARESDLNYSWLTKFKDGRINNPTIVNLDRLIRYLDRDNVGVVSPSVSTTDQARAA